MTSAQPRVGILYSAAWLCLAGAVLLLKVTEMALPIGGDQGIYSYIGQETARGGVPYRDFWEPKPPGVFYVRAAIQTLVPSNWATPCISGPLRVSCPWLALQAADYLYTLALAAAVYATARAISLPRAASMLAAALCTIFVSYVRVSQQGMTPEKLLLLPAIMAVLAAVRGSRDSAATWWWPAAGALTALVVLLKQSGAMVVVPILLLSLRGSPPPRSLVGRWAWFVAGLLVPILATAGVLLVQGALGPMIEQTYLLNFQRFTVSSEYNAFGGASMPESLREAWQYAREGLAPFWLVGGIGLLAALRRRQEVLFVIAVWAVAETIVAVGLRQFLQLFPSYALLGGWMLHRLWLAASKPTHLGLDSAFAARALVVLSIGGIAALSFGFQGGVMVRALNERGPRDFLRSADEWVASDVRQLAPGPIYVWGGDAHVYLLADRPAATRYLNNVVLLPGWRGRDEAYATIVGDLRSIQPSAIVVSGRVYWEPLRIERFPELQRIVDEGYDALPADTRYGTWRIYRRRDT